MQCEFRIDIHGILVEIAFWTIVKYVVGREGVELVELFRHEHFTERLILTCANGIEFG